MTELQATDVETNGRPPFSDAQRIAGEVFAPTQSSWSPVDLGPLLRGEQVEMPPAFLARTDGLPLLYRAKVHSLSGEPEAGKGWVMLYAAAECLSRGEHVIYLDFEDTASTIVGRLRNLGVDGGRIARALHYVRPEVPLDDAARGELQDVLAYQPTLAIIDGVTEALVLHGLDLRDNGDVAEFLQGLPRLLVASGAAVVLSDHVVKDREGRGRYAIGAQHKLAGVDVGFKLEVDDPFGRGRHGLARLSVTKDRPGFLRQDAVRGGLIAEVAMSSTAEGRATLALRPPAGAVANESSTFRPTVLMESTSKALEEQPGLSKRALRGAVRGAKNDYKDLALELLIEDGYVRVVREGQTFQHYSERPFRKDPEAPACPHAPTVPHRAPGTVVDDRAPVPSPIGARGTGHTPGGDRTCDCEASKPRPADDGLVRCAACEGLTTFSGAA